MVIMLLVCSSCCRQVRLLHWQKLAGALPQPSPNMPHNFTASPTRDQFLFSLVARVAAVRIGSQCRSVGVYTSTKTKADKGHGSDCGLGERKPRERSPSISSLGNIGQQAALPQDLKYQLFFQRHLFLVVFIVCILGGAIG